MTLCFERLSKVINKAIDKTSILRNTDYVKKVPTGANC
jgi:hypothetical protein